MKFSENEPVLFAKRRSAEPLRLTDAAAKDRHRPAARDIERVSAPRPPVMAVTRSTTFSHVLAIGDLDHHSCFHRGTPCLRHPLNGEILRLAARGGRWLPMRYLPDVRFNLVDKEG